MNINSWKCTKLYLRWLSWITINYFQNSYLSLKSKLHYFYWEHLFCIISQVWLLHFAAYVSKNLSKLQTLPFKFSADYRLFTFLLVTWRALPRRNSVVEYAVDLYIPCKRGSCIFNFELTINMSGRGKGGKGLGKGGAKCHGKFLRDNMKLITKN